MPSRRRWRGSGPSRNLLGTICGLLRENYIPPFDNLIGTYTRPRIAVFLPSLTDAGAYYQYLSA